MLCDDVLWCAEYEGKRGKQARTHRVTSLRLEGCDEESKEEEERLEADDSSNARSFLAYLILGVFNAALSTVSIVSLVFFFSLRANDGKAPYLFYPLVVAATEPSFLISFYALPYVRMVLDMRTVAILLSTISLISWAIYLFAVSGLLSERYNATAIFFLFTHRVLLGLSGGLQILFLEFLRDLPTHSIASSNDLILNCARTWLGPGIGLLLAFSRSTRDKRVIFNRLTGVAWISLAAILLSLVFVFKHAAFQTILLLRPRSQVLAERSSFVSVECALYFCCGILGSIVIWGFAWNLVEIVHQHQESDKEGASVFLLFLPIALGGCFGSYCSLRRVFSILSRYRFIFIRKAEEVSVVFGGLLLLMSFLTLLTSFLFLRHDSFKYYGVITSSTCLFGLALAYFSPSLERLHVIYSSGEHDSIAACVYRRAVSDSVARFFGVLATGLLLAFNLLTLWLYLYVSLVVVSLTLALVASWRTWRVDAHPLNNTLQRERAATTFLANEHITIDIDVVD